MEIKKENITHSPVEVCLYLSACSLRDTPPAKWEKDSGLGVTFPEKSLVKVPPLPHALWAPFSFCHVAWRSWASQAQPPATAIHDQLFAMTFWKFSHFLHKDFLVWLQLFFHTSALNKHAESDILTCFQAKHSPTDNCKTVSGPKKKERKKKNHTQKKPFLARGSEEQTNCVLHLGDFELFPLLPEPQQEQWGRDCPSWTCVSFPRFQALAGLACISPSSCSSFTF